METWYLCTLEYYWAIKKAIPPFVTSADESVRHYLRERSRHRNTVILWHVCVESEKATEARNRTVGSRGWGEGMEESRARLCPTLLLPCIHSLQRGSASTRSVIGSPNSTQQGCARELLQDVSYISKTSVRGPLSCHQFLKYEPTILRQIWSHSSW